MIILYLKNNILKYSLLGAGLFGVVILGNIAAQAMYARSKVGTDKKALALSLLGGVAVGGVIMYSIKK